MATSQDFIDYVIEQAQGPWALCARKMFGEYMVYANDKPVLLVCDNQVFAKILPELEGVLAGAETGHPYDGARLHSVVDVDDPQLVQRVIAVLEPITQVPKRRAARRTRAPK